MGRVYVGDIGTEIRLFVGVVIDDAITANISVRKPDGTETTWVAQPDGNEVVYFAQDGDLDQEGDYYMQAAVELISWSGCGETAVLKVWSRFAR